MTQGELAEKINVDRTTYRNIEKGDTKILGGHLDEIATALGTTTEYLVIGYDPGDADDNPFLAGMMEDERKSWDEKTQKLEMRISALIEENAQKEKRIEELERWLRDKEQINAFLSSKIAQLEGGNAR